MLMRNLPKTEKANDDDMAYPSVLKTRYSLFLRNLAQLLNDLNMFVLSIDMNSNKQDVLSISNQRPNRERQKLAREQNVLKLVCNN